MNFIRENNNYFVYDNLAIKDFPVHCAVYMLLKVINKISV